MRRVAVLNVVGLTRRLLGEALPRIREYARRHGCRLVDPALPAVTCTAQSNYLTGRRPSDHGIVANGWYDRALGEVQFWKQSNRLVGARKIWEDLREACPGFTCANLFWWYNLYSSVDLAITPRPMYPADGRKVFDIASWPPAVRPAIKRDLGDFPFPTFWGPAAGVDSPQGPPDAASRWIAASARWIEERHAPTLQLVYLPHLDYNLQRWGPSDPRVRPDLDRIDAIVGDLLDFYARRHVTVLLVSEYGISDVRTPIALNRVLRARGWLAIKEELGLELLDAGHSRAFAVADHQVAHVHVQDPTILGAVRGALESVDGVAEVWDREAQRAHGLDHARSGDFVVFSRENAWFTYYYWDEDRLAPDFARCVDIHRKPGYDPVELFLDPARKAVRLQIAWKLLRKKLGFRMLMDVIPLDAGLVRGSHGCRPSNTDEWPVCIAPGGAGDAPISSTDVYAVIRGAVAGS